MQSQVHHRTAVTGASPHCSSSSSWHQMVSPVLTLLCGDHTLLFNTGFPKRWTLLMPPSG